jgi:hypothetical protein
MTILGKDIGAWWCAPLLEKRQNHWRPQIKKMLEQDDENLVRTRALEYLLLEPKIC